MTVGDNCGRLNGHLMPNVVLGNDLEAWEGWERLNIVVFDDAVRISG